MNDHIIQSIFTASPAYQHVVYAFFVCIGNDNELIWRGLISVLARPLPKGTVPFGLLEYACAWCQKYMVKLGKFQCSVPPIVRGILCFKLTNFVSASG